MKQTFRRKKNPDFIVALQHENCFSVHYKKVENEISHFLKNFQEEGAPFGDGNRNEIKLFSLQDKTLNIKSFGSLRILHLGCTKIKLNF